MMTKTDHDCAGRHRRALRAARAATLGLALAGGGCYLQNDTSPGPDASDAMVRDAARLAADAAPARDGSASDGGVDAARADAGAADAGTCVRDGEWLACCEAHDWDPRWGCLAWGPFVPPAEGALPPSRSAVRQGRA